MSLKSPSADAPSLARMVATCPQYGPVNVWASIRQAQRNQRASGADRHRYASCPPSEDLLQVVVLGDINIDTPGIAAASLHEIRQGGPSGELGGHAANQAIAAASFGAATQLIGRVGRDRQAVAALDYLRGRGVLLDGVTRSEQFDTGTAILSRDVDGSVKVTCNPGANYEVGSHELAVLSTLLRRKDLLLVQFGVPRWVVREAIIIAKNRLAISVLDPAPWWNLKVNDELVQIANMVTPNINELATFSGSLLQIPRDVWAVGREFARAAAGDVIVTLGEDGAYVYPREKAPFHLFPRPVAAVDPLAAGDTFNGVMAAALTQDVTFETAVRTGMAAASLTVQRHGSSSSIPVRNEILHQLTRGLIEKKAGFDLQ